MTMFTYISQNFDRVKFDIRIGLIPCATLKHFQVYSRYDYYKKLGHTVSSAVVCAGIDLGVHESWVYEIIKKMEKEV